jgi:hypothetical protein
MLWDLCWLDMQHNHFIRASSLLRLTYYQGGCVKVVSLREEQAGRKFLPDFEHPSNKLLRG